MDRRLQVFVSSTYLDLVPERQAAVQAILKAGHIPAGMELFTAGDQSQMNTIRQWIDQSDVYMLILGARYGSIEPSSGLSYTELEYDYAVSQNKPFFAVVLRPECLEARVKERGLGVAERENLALMKKFEAKVLSNLSSFFEDEKDIKLCVFETLPVFHANRDLVGWVRGDQVIDSGPFIEQNERLSRELAQVRAALQAAQQKLEKSNSSDDDKLAEIRGTLASIPVEVPTNILPAGTEKPWKTNMLTFLSANCTRLMGGVSNRSGQGDLTTFLYWNVANVLAIHGLMKNVKVQGSVRNYDVTPFGLKVMSALDAEYHREEAAKLEKKNERDAQASAATGDSVVRGEAVSETDGRSTKPEKKVAKRVAVKKAPAKKSGTSRKES